jgi:hypothetical protein
MALRWLNILTEVSLSQRKWRLLLLTLATFAALC